MKEHSTTPPLNVSRMTALLVPIVLALAVCGCAIYANLSFAVARPADYRYFPPFEPGHNANMNRHLGAEYFNIAKAMVGGQGFANPFGAPTGPTAWMPPLLPTLLAGLLWICDGDRDAVMTVVVFMQVVVLIGTGLLVLALARTTTQKLGAIGAAVVFYVALLSNFHNCFQFTHDCWLVLLSIDLVIAGLCWFGPLQNGKRAAAWGLVGGLCALVNPVVAFAWGMSTVVTAFLQRAWSRLGIAVLIAGIALTPWTIRNYRVFGRLVPIKSNAAYEFYQSQCLQKDGLIRNSTFAHHPYGSGTRERQEYKQLGEMAFLDRKREQFLQAVWADPLDFLDRAACRFLGATLWYEPFNPRGESKHPWSLLFSRLTHPLPFVGLLVLLLTSIWRPLHPWQWIVIGVYLCYLMPYVAISYYERYGLPLLAAKVLLVIWGADRLMSLSFGAKRKSGRQCLTRPSPGVAQPGKAALVP
jgi:hypothetical protein